MIWNLVKSIFSNSRSLDSVDNTINHIAKGIDKFTYTDQEKAEANAKGLDYHLKFVEASTKQNSDQSKARRNIANKWINLYLNLAVGYLVTVGLSLKWTAVATLAVAFKEILIILGTGTLVILGFYYGVHLLRGIPIGKKK